MKLLQTFVVTVALMLPGLSAAKNKSPEGTWSYLAVYSHPTDLVLGLKGFVIVDGLTMTNYIISAGKFPCQHTTVSEFTDDSYTSFMSGDTKINLEISDKLVSSNIIFESTFMSGNQFFRMELTPANPIDPVELLSELPYCVE